MTRVIVQQHTGEQTVFDWDNLTGEADVRRRVLEAMPGHHPEFLSIFVEQVGMLRAAPTADILGSALSSEAGRRAKAAELKEFLDDEQAAQVALLHEIFRRDWPRLRDLRLRGDYGAPVELKPQYYRNRPEEMCLNQICHPVGIILDGGSRISTFEFRVTVNRRTTRDAPFCTQVYVTRAYPYQNDEGTKFHLDIRTGNAAETVMGEFYKMLAPHIISPIEGSKEQA